MLTLDDIEEGDVLSVPYWKEEEKGEMPDDYGYMRYIGNGMGMWYGDKAYFEEMETPPGSLHELKDGDLVLCGCFPQDGLIDMLPDNLEYCSVVSEKSINCVGFIMFYGTPAWEIVRYTFPVGDSKRDAAVAVKSALNLSPVFEKDLANGDAELISIPARPGFCEVCHHKRNSCRHIVLVQRNVTCDAYLIGPECARRFQFAAEASDRILGARD